MSVCRFCKQHSDSLVKYGTRHYAHARCGLEAQGEAFFDNLTEWQIANFPYIVARQFGFGERVERAYRLQGFDTGGEVCNERPSQRGRAAAASSDTLTEQQRIELLEGQPR